MRTIRALSSGHIEKYELMDELHYQNSPDRPIHRPTQSLFTTSSGFTNFRGLFTWGCFLLLITTARMALENILKYGIVMDPSAWLLFILRSSEKHLALGLLLCCNLFILIAWILELMAARQALRDVVVLFLSCCNLVSVLTFPTLVIWYHEFNPLFSSPVLAVYTIIFLKLWSYVAVNRWCRSAHSHLKIDSVFVDQLFQSHQNAEKDGSDVSPGNPKCGEGDQHSSLESKGRRRRGSGTVQISDTGRGDSSSHPTNNYPYARRRFHASRQSVGQVESYRTMLDAIEAEPTGITAECREISSLGRFVTYPDNLTVKDLYYFILAPTLCYELNFPRTLTRRKRFILKRLFEVVFISQLILCLTQQWLLPLLKNSVTPISESNFSQIVERCLKLAIPNHFLWLLFFYSTFHSFLNLVGELTRFGDRFFYSDWWNAETVPAFWSKWNIPVHRFARRHIYLPLVNAGMSRPQAGMVVFFISALLHEFLISVPLKMPRMWAFLCMFSQMPYAMLVHRLFPKGGAFGNVAVWITLIIGQPLAMLLYFHDYYISYYNN